jgi:hypothetical protein
MLLFAVAAVVIGGIVGAILRVSRRASGAGLRR